MLHFNNCQFYTILIIIGLQWSFYIQKEVLEYTHPFVQVHTWTKVGALTTMTSDHYKLLNFK